jgi:hypothetical protein
VEYYPEEFRLEFKGGLETIGVATHPMTTTPSDEPPSMPLPGLLTQSFNFGVNLFDNTDPVNVVGRSGIGSIQIEDPRDLMGNAMRNWSWDTREIQIWRGPRGKPFSQFTKVAVLESAGISAINTQRKEVALRDLQQSMYKTSLRLNTYAGTGGADGDASITGVLKPVTYGRVRNRPLQMVNSVKLIMQWHDAAVEGVDALQDGGSDLAYQGNQVSYAALEAMTLTPGQYATCNAVGMVRAGGVAQYGFRLYGRGDATGTGYVETIVPILQRMMTTRGAIPLQPTDLDTASFDALNAKYSTQIIGIVVGEETLGELIDKVLQGIAGWWYVSMLRKLRIGQLEEPKDVADFTFDHAKKDIIGEVESEAWITPRQLTRLGYWHNWGPQNPSELGTGLTGDRIRELGQDTKWGENVAEGVRIEFPTARIVELPYYWYNKADADAECLRQNALMSKDRRSWVVPVILDPFTDVLGKTVQILNYQKHGFGSSKRFYCKGITSLDAGSNAKLLLWAGR